MRKGANPAKLGTPAYRVKKLGIATITYIPSQIGYFAESLEILKFHLQSLHQFTLEEFDLLVFDNGSCHAVCKELQKMQAEGSIDGLFLSIHNYSKVGALNWILPAIPNEWVCITDSDVLFRKGWFEESMKIAQAFPKAGMIGAQPGFFDVLAGKSKARINLEEKVPIEFDHYKPENWIVEEYCQSLDIEPENQAEFYSKQLDVIRNTKNSIEAVLGASHMQFLASRNILRQIGELPVTYGLNRNDIIELDRRIDELGYLHLSTKIPYVVHMGNEIDDRLQKELDSLALLKNDQHVIKKGNDLYFSSTHKTINSLLRFKWFKRIALKVYLMLFQAFSERGS
jgi:glycosyltransferase involved in cell wall biosynthesis